MTTVQEILDAAQALPSGDRAQIITALWDSVSADDWTPPGDEWLSEAQRRSDVYDNGQMTSSPWPEVRQRTRRESLRPVVVFPEVLSEAARRADEVSADPSIAIDDQELWRRIDG